MNDMIKIGGVKMSIEDIWADIAELPDHQWEALIGLKAYTRPDDRAECFNCGGEVMDASQGTGERMCNRCRSGEGLEPEEGTQYDAEQQELYNSITSDAAQYEYEKLNEGRTYDC